LKLLNLVEPAAILREAYSCFATHTTQMHGWCGDGDPLNWLRSCPAESRIVLQAEAQTREGAVELAAGFRRLQEIQRRRAFLSMSHA